MTVTLALLLGLGAALPGAARATVSLAAWIQHSPDDLSGFSTLTGNDNTANATIPFNVTIEGVNYSTVTISTNGWLEFGGNTQGTSHPGNVCLPTSTHTNPFLAAYWDDLNPFGTIIRYGTVGTNPHRTWIADFEVDLNTGSEGADDLRFQVQVHEGSSLINVRYRNQQSATNGLAATIGFQGAGGAAGNAQPLTCNGKVLDDNRSDEGWSVDASRAGNVVLFAFMAHSPDDISGFTQITGNDTVNNVALPFPVTVEGTAYNSIGISTNGWLELGGNSAANSDPGNACLPTSQHTRPLIAYYWDDMQTQGSAIRYGTVGTSPNRTFIVDFQMDVVAQGSADVVNGQVQIHETSNLINVKYRDGGNNNANGQAATIGFQGAGGASAAAYPLTCNGKILDDNRPDEGWSVHPRALGAMSLHSVMEFSPDDISGFASLSGDNAIAGVTLPFTVTIDGVGYTTATIGTNGILQFGTLSGANPTNNTALPSASFSGPTVFWMWDDLAPEASNIQYATVGTPPNRTFIVDFQANRVGDSGSKVNGQVQVHETSNVINVKYRSTLSVNSNGQNATIGFQSAGGASATAYPLTFNGKILDDNLPNSGWSISPLPICGNSVVETKEACDQGGSNGAATSCCTSVCAFRAAGQTCRAAAGECDLAETCTGSGGACPGNAFKPSNTACTDDGNVCTTDLCNGSSVFCQHAPGNAGATCRASAGVCDVVETCDGVSASCPADVFVSSATTCRPAAGVCDAAENCTGAAAACPGDAKVASGSVCRSAAGVCDVAEACDGSGDDCPTDVFVSSATVCRSAAGVCDVAESCTGSAAACPSDAKVASGSVCRSSAGICDVAEACDGAGDDCPTDVFVSSATVCRSAAGVCDVAESCTGSAAACPGDVKVASGTVCRSSAGVCDVAEACDGSDDDCPTDVFVSASTVCRSAAGMCDVAESCTGSGVSCPADAFEASTTVCRPGSGDLCDPDESCTGSGAACPSDVVTPSSTVCRSSAGVCDVVESCTGVAGEGCPADSVSGAFVVCRSAAGECDATENCDGSGVSCPADAKEPANTGCTADANVCTLDVCDGVGNLCAHPAGNGGTLCRAAAGPCDLAETCDGANTACPADAKAPTSTPCRASAGVCDVAESCDGTNDACPADDFVPSSTVCRSSAAACDVAESCTGASANCPADSFAPSGTVCRSAAGVCDLAESCTGSGVACPSDAFQPATTVCRSAVGACDIAEQCTGSGAACPADVLSPDSDGDTVCDAIDDCPTVPDPGQADTDNDGDGDACDICTNTLPSFADRGKVVIGKLNTPNTPPGDDTAKIKGRCIPFQETPTIDPMTNGVRLVVQDAMDNTPIDVTIPGGAYSTVTKAGWKVHTFPTGMTAQYKNAGTVVPLINGIKKVKFVLKSGQGITKFNAVGKNGDYPLGPSGLPVKVTFIADPPIAETGQCCEMFFPGPPPAPSCVFNGSGSTARCK